MLILGLCVRVSFHVNTHDCARTEKSKACRTDEYLQLRLLQYLGVIRALPSETLNLYTLNAFTLNPKPLTLPLDLSTLTLKTLTLKPLTLCPKPCQQNMITKKL